MATPFPDLSSDAVAGASANDFKEPQVDIVGLDSLTNGHTETPTVNVANSIQVDDDWVYPYPTDFRIDEHAIDDVKELKVAVIGAGLAGINAAILLPAKVPGIKVTVIDKNDDVGGTWLENIYPGVRCDIPSNVYQSTFSPKTDWSEEYAQGPEILAYWQQVARKHDVYSRTRLRTRVRGAYWDEASGQWRLELQNLQTNEDYAENFDFLINAIGHFNEWKLPSIPGLHDFRGHLRHSSNWDPSFDPKGKRVATIGNGASGIQLTTELQKVVAHIDHYARNKTWIAGNFVSGVKDRQAGSMPFSHEQHEEWRRNPTAYLAFRKDLEEKFFRGFDAQLRESDATKNSIRDFRESMRKRLADRPELVERLVPDFPPFCRRLTPGPGYLEALARDNLEFIQTPIQRITSDGIVTADGVHRPVDAIICSTGANVHFAPPFPIVAGDLDLSRDWKDGGKWGFPYNYMGTATPGFPNLAFLLGPNPAGAAGTVPHGAEVQITYVAKMLRKISRERIKSMVPTRQATDDFLKYCDAFFPRTNMSRNCSSWYNGGRPGGRIHGCWPGSANHLANVLREPRWEDFEYSYARRDDGLEGSRFAWLGDGTTMKEQDPGADLVSYLRLPAENDLKDLHERWWDL